MPRLHRCWWLRPGAAGAVGPRCNGIGCKVICLYVCFTYLPSPQVSELLTHCSRQIMGNDYNKADPPLSVCFTHLPSPQVSELLTHYSRQIMGEITTVVFSRCVK